MKIVVIIPTYNERKNIEPMVTALTKEKKLIEKHDLQVLYVDDTSPDKTYEVIRQMQKKYKWIHLLLNKKKEGLGGAYVKGMKYAVKKLKADAFVEFDADFQHNPKEIKDLIKAFDKGADYVIGSRYVKGGSIPVEWEFKRKFLSVVGNWVARVLLLLPKIHDVTTGFKLTRVKGFSNKLSLDPEKLFSKSFAYKIQLLHEMIQAGAKVKEVPIQFAPRTIGESKLIKNEMFETLRLIFLLQMNNPKIQQFVKFGVVGFIGYVVQAIGLQVLSMANSPEWLIWGGSAEISIMSNFTWNNLWTFSDQKISGRSKVLKKFFHFNVTSAGAIVIQMVAGGILVNMFGPEYRQLYLPLIIAFLVVPYNYLIYTKLIWKK